MTETEKVKLKSELLSQKDHIGVSFENIIKQLEIFEKGIPFVNLLKPCKIGDGIKLLDKEQKQNFLAEYQKKLSTNSVIKFVPASGAASRMFKKLQTVISSGNDVNLKKLKTEAEAGNENSKAAVEFLENIHKFAFYEDLEAKMFEKGFIISELIAENNIKDIIRFTLDEAGLNYADSPKGSLKFHSYPDGSRTAFEEHIVEAINYSQGKEGFPRIHFTISPEHFKSVQSIIKSVVNKYSKSQNKIEVNYSFQKSSTDTLAVTLDNKPFRDEDGKLLFRPGGHGALLENLNDLDADIIFIKNIDNVAPDHLKLETYEYKKVLCGLLLLLQAKVFSYLKILESNETNDQIVNDIIQFCIDELEIILNPKIKDMSLHQKNKYLFSELNKPIRVCGMVVNEGHPGGGPFWVKDKDGNISKQVIETTQIDMQNPDQKKILDTATHFSPVDFVCGVKSYAGIKFNLKDFVDSDSGLIAIKSYGGKELKALELPGLWNGGMANWLTIFVEVPKITFTPVKEVNDLLRWEHQPPEN